VREDVLVILPDGTVAGVWSDEVPWHEIGRVAAAPRLSRVEWDPSRQQWVATDIATGQEVAASPSRREALEAEHAYYCRQLAAGSLPVPHTGQQEDEP
jgi:hypothetical protein